MTHYILIDARVAQVFIGSISLLGMIGWFMYALERLKD